MFFIKKILSPFTYILISHKEKTAIGLILPFILAVALVVSEIINIKIIEGVNTLIPNMFIGYILFLILTVSLKNKLLDEYMKGVPPTLNGKQLTRRKFLLHLFNFLIVMSVLVYVLGVYFMQVLIDPNIEKYVKTIIEIFYVTLFFNLFFNTILGLFFIVNKIQEE